MNAKPSARARLEAYMAHESDADQAEFVARVDAVVAEEAAALKAVIARARTLAEKGPFIFDRDGRFTVLVTDVLAALDDPAAE